MKQHSTSGNLQGDLFTQVDEGEQGEEGEAREQVTSQKRTGLVVHVWAFNILCSEEPKRNKVRRAF